MFKFAEIIVGILIISICYEKVNAQTCSIVEAYIVPGSYNIAQQVSTGFCQEWIIGPVTTSKRILIQLPQINVNCALGDKLTVYSSDRVNTLYDYCNPSINTYGDNVFTEAKYVFLRLSTSSSRPLSLILAFYILESTITSTTTITTTTTTTTTTTSSTAATPTCGNPYYKPNESVRIVGGIEATPFSWPWQAFITDGSGMCGASLINNQWLVTAAHCIEGVNMRSFKAYLGVHNLNKLETSTVIKSIVKAIPHGSYIGQRNSWDNDIALLKLAEPINYTNEISPICLPEQGVDYATIGSSAFVTGWGRISGSGPTSDVLRQTTVTVREPYICNANTINMICAGRAAPISDSCGGDSGGPKVMKIQNAFHLTGIVSWGSADCTGDGVYTKVSNYINWIKGTIANN